MRCVLFVFVFAAANPEITCEPLTENHEFFILACDGKWRLIVFLFILLLKQCSVLQDHTKCFKVNLFHTVCACFGYCAFPVLPRDLSLFWLYLRVFLCLGIWDCKSSQEVVTFVRQRIAQKMLPDEVRRAETFEAHDVSFLSSFIVVFACMCSDAFLPYVM